MVIFGTIRPTKTMDPATASEIPANILMGIIIIHLINFMF
ncbi:hypothetical protein JMUB7499_26920 [Staphylococcus aureus]